MTWEAGSYILRDDGGIGPALQLPVTSNHAPGSMLSIILDETLNGVEALHVPCPYCSESVAGNSLG